MTNPRNCAGELRGDCGTGQWGARGWTRTNIPSALSRTCPLPIGVHRAQPASPPPERPKRFRVMNATACCTGRPNLHLSPVCVKLSEGHGRISKIKRVLDEIKRVWLLQGVRVARNRKGPFPALLSSLARCEGAAPCGTTPLASGKPGSGRAGFHHLQGRDDLGGGVFGDKPQ